MALYINTNTAALRSMVSLSSAASRLNSLYGQLATGSRITSSRVDPAGFMIADRMTSQINGLTQGSRNANDGISLCQTAEGAADEVSGMLQRMRVLALQSANGTNSDSERSAIQQETDELCKEIQRIGEQTSWGGTKRMLDGSMGITKFQVGAYAGQTISAEFSKLTFAGLLSAASADMKFTLSAGKDPGDGVLLREVEDYDGLNGDSDSKVEVDGAAGAKGAVYSLSMNSAESAQQAIKVLDRMISRVDSKRASWGAVGNRLGHAIANNSNTLANISDARSRIADLDYAEATAEASRLSIMQQAAAMMFTQAMNSSSIILKLLGSI